MAKCVLARASLVRAVLLGATALAFLSSPLTVGEATAKVGVTSATDGDPLGKPPQEAERVLRIGIDVQANELVTTSANDRAHLVFLDGSSLTVGPNAQLTIDKFVFDPTTKTGELAINASKGVLRLVGGKISKGQPITITTPSSTIGIRGGITILDVKQGQTQSTFVFGKDMTVRGAGQTQVATRPGSMIVTNFGGPPGMPAMLAQGALNAQLAALEGRRDSQGSGGSGGGRNADDAAQGSGFSGANSGQSARSGGDNFGTGPGPRNRNPNDTIVTALSNANQSFQTTTALQQLAVQPLTVSPPLPPPPTTVGPPSPITPDRPRPPDPPQTAGVTYKGTMAGLVRGQGFATGNYQSTWNFAQRNGTFTATFDGANFQGAITGGHGGTFYTPQAIQSSNKPRQLENVGTFVGPGSQPNGQAGVFSINGSGRYSAGGGFAGTKQP
jgi:FecR protein